MALRNSIMAIRVAARFMKRVGMEFATPEALQDYLHEHPGADKSLHSVKKEESKESKPESGPASKDLFDAKEVENLPESAGQPDKNPDTLFKHAKEAHDLQLNWLNHGKGLDKDIGAKVVRGDKKPLKEFLADLAEQLDKPGPVVVIGPMKSQERSKEKVEADFGGDWSRLTDAVRASVAVDSFDQLDEVVKKLKKAGLKLARKPKDRFANPTEAGYRDMLLNVKYPNGHVGELQLHLKPVLKAKDQGHKFYEEVRSIEAKASKEGRKEMTADELRIVNEANKKSRDLYAKAWAEATKVKAGKTAMEREAAKTKYYDYEGMPAYWAGAKFPVIVQGKGKQTVVYKLQKFFETATPITEEEFEALKKSLKG